jgi:transposase-like protein
MPKCPHCGSEDLTRVRTWRFIAYDVTQYKCNKCGRTFLHYVNTRGEGEPEEFYIWVKTRPTETT